MHFKTLFPLAAALSLYLGLSNGHLAIFHQADAKPLQTLPYDAALFSESDQEILKRGIPFSTAADLNKLLEDYTS